MSRGTVKITGDRRADKRLDTLAAELGFTTKNVMLRHVANELARCAPRNFFKAVAQFSAYCQRKDGRS